MTDSIAVARDFGAAGIGRQRVADLAARDADRVTKADVEAGIATLEDRMPTSGIGLAGGSVVMRACPTFALPRASSVG